MIIMFGWLFVKRFNFLFISLIVLFVDMIYLFYFYIFGIYIILWRFVFLNIFFFFVIVMNFILVVRVIVNNRELEGLLKIWKIVEIILILCG